MLHPRETRVHRNCRRRAPRTIDLEGWSDCCRGSSRASARTYVGVKENRSKTQLSHLSVPMLPLGPSRTSTPPEALAICSALKMTPPSSISQAGEEVEGSSSSSDDDARQLLTARLFFSCATTFQLGVVGVDDERFGRRPGDGDKGELAAASDATCIAAGAGRCVSVLHRRRTLVVGCHRSKIDCYLFFFELFWQRQEQDEKTCEAAEPVRVALVFFSTTSTCTRSFSPKISTYQYV